MKKSNANIDRYSTNSNAQYGSSRDKAYPHILLLPRSTCIYLLVHNDELLLLFLL